MRNTLKYLQDCLKLDKKECSGLQKSMILKRLKIYNKKNGSSHYINWSQVGQADLFQWEIIERWNDFNPFQTKMVV